MINEDHSFYWNLVDAGQLRFTTFLDEGNVRLLWELGMYEVNGRLLRMDLGRAERDCGLAEFEQRVRRAQCWAVRRVLPVAFGDPDDWASEGLGSRMGVYVLFFGSAWQSRTPLFSNKVMLCKWGPRVRRYDDWLVYLQRKVRGWLAARRRLAFAMCLHARLGACSAASCLGLDLAARICELALE
jgi:hypothetical protein